ncbi:MAG: hypothetical protein S0880_14985 [Actinomycetota bacterium]|nr:hypothetical protein [Actinomycetota bacterium]
MGPGDERSRARLALVTAGGVVPVGTIPAERTCDLGLVEQLLRLQLAARRAGGELRVTVLDPELQDLIELVGVADLLDG